MTGDSEIVIQCEDLDVGYGKLVAARSLDLHVAAGEVVALLGPNGVGKTTTLLSLAGVLPTLGGRVLWLGQRATEPLHVRARRGLAFIPEERSVVMGMSVRDNLRLGHVATDHAVDLFPELGRLLGRRAGLLSGGEQQMLTLARAILRRPRAIIVDELSFGLAPIVADRLVLALRGAASSGIAVLVVEQNLTRALMVADRFYLMRDGRITLSAKPSDYEGRLDALEELVVGPAAASESRQGSSA